MPDVRTKNIIAVFCADLHLTLQMPACRNDKDWMAVQADYLKQLKKIAGQAPILCAGDIFDKWNAAPELINFALQHLPKGMICVPGQHDLPSHRLDLMHRSGYGVLVEARRIVDISDNTSWGVSDMLVSGFSWTQEVRPLTEPTKKLLKVALVHEYVWTDDEKFPGAPDECNVIGFKKALKGYDVAVFGDNHKGFLSSAGDCTVLNCGGFIRRKSDEIDYNPCVGLLYSDGSVARRKLDTSADRFHPIQRERPETAFDMSDFLSGLEKLGEHGLDFREAVSNHLKANADDVHPDTMEIIQTVLNENETKN